MPGLHLYPPGALAPPATCRLIATQRPNALCRSNAPPSTSSASCPPNAPYHFNTRVPQMSPYHPYASWHPNAPVALMPSYRSNTLSPLCLLLALVPPVVLIPPCRPNTPPSPPKQKPPSLHQSALLLNFSPSAALASVTE